VLVGSNGPNVHHMWDTAAAESRACVCVCVCACATSHQIAAIKDRMTERVSQLLRSTAGLTDSWKDVTCVHGFEVDWRS